MFATGHLFAGGGGGLYADLILGHTPAFAVEWDPYACAILRSRAADGWFPGLRVHEGSARLFDPSEYAGAVDCIHAGFPCQDISTAGRGDGINGERSGLYREVLRCADVIRPRFLFLENVSAITSRGLGQVLGDLAERGYDARWTCLAASEVGANHERMRWWCLAHAQGNGHRQGGEVGNIRQADGGPISELLPVSGRPGPEAADSGSGRFGRADRREMEQPRGTEAIRPGEDVANAICGEFQRLGKPGELDGAPGAREGREEERERLRDAVGDSRPDLAHPYEIGRDGRPREQRQGWRGQLAEGSSKVSQPSGAGLAERDRRELGQWPYATTAGGGWWTTEPNLDRVVNGMALRSHQIRALGNGQVPLAAAAAWKILGGP
ncbi:MAG: DNA cytosine methyltransferase [Fibrobacterota bacterium]|nr:DNA cytosine methyltransferase [Fibrobacterota bacterium]